MMDLDNARTNMITQQLRTANILDERLLNIMTTIHRDQFVPTAFRNLAYADTPIPIGHDQVMMTPRDEGLMLNALDIRETDSILEIGTGSAYVTALLSKMGKQVFSLEIIESLHKEATTKLKQHAIHNVTLLNQNGVNGLESEAPFDIIVYTGSLPYIPPQVTNVLNTGGRLFGIIGDGPGMQAILVTRNNENEWTEESLFETDVPALIDGPQENNFHF